MGEPAAVAAVPEPLAWQAAALEDYSAKQERDYLLAAWVGVGKTRWALLTARTLLDTGIVARVVVVVHTRYLRRQWRDEAASIEIQLRSRWYNGLSREEDDFQGICTTYQSIAPNPEVYNAQCVWKDTLVICDEIHHVADDPQGRWGSALRTAFNARTRGIYLSATPFRTDGAPIPFLRYNGEQVCIPNFVYGYRDALADRAIRRVAFAQIEGDLRWLGPHGLHQAKSPIPFPLRKTCGGSLLRSTSGVTGYQPSWPMRMSGSARFVTRCKLTRADLWWRATLRMPAA